MNIQKIEILPSLLAADFSNLSYEIRKIERAGCKKIHLDIMDGHFVPNITFGPALIRSIRKVTSLYFQAHLMIYNPERYLEDFKKAGVNGIIIHEEACHNFRKALKTIRRLKLNAGITLKPKTAVRSIKDIIDEIDYILIMTVEPGFSGQAFIRGSETKVEETRKLVRDSGLAIPIGVDGGINLKTIARVAKAGANELICGEAVFAGNVMKNIRSLYNKANEVIQ